MGEIDGIEPDMVRRKWTYVVLAKGFGKGGGSDLLFQFDEATRRVDLCENQDDLKQSIALDLEAVKESLDLAEIQKKSGKSKIDVIPCLRGLKLWRYVLKGDSGRVANTQRLSDKMVDPPFCYSRCHGARRRAA